MAYEEHRSNILGSRTSRHRRRRRPRRPDDGHQALRGQRARRLLFSLVPVKRSHSVCAQGGINAAVNTKGEGDSPAGPLRRDGLRRRLPRQPAARQGDVRRGAGHHLLLDRMGVPFNRTPEGLLDFRRFGGTLFHRTAFAGATTGQQLLYALDEQVRRYETVDVEDEHGVAIPARRWSASTSSGSSSGRARRRRRAAAASSRRT